MVRSDIIKEVRESQVFSLLADETKDLSKKEQLSFVLRYYYDGAVHESFLDFQQANKLDAASLTTMIIASLEKYGLEYRSHLVGQGYDGASVMSGRHSGVSARIKAEAKYAFYVHCSAHCLNLVLVDTVKSVPEADNFFAVLQRLYVFISGSYLHQKWIEVQKEMYEGQPRELHRLSDTRWTCRQSACRNLIDRLPAVIRLLEDITNESSGDRAVDAQCLLSQIDVTFIGLLVIFNKILTHSKFLSDMIQSPGVDLAKAVELVDVLLETLQNYRDEDAFEKIWTEVKTTCQKCEISVTMAKKRQRKVSYQLDGSLVMSTVGVHSEPGDTDSFRQSIFYPILDCMVGELKRRFSKQNCEIMNGIQALHPKSTTFLDEKSLFPFARIYDSNLEDLKHEIHQVQKLLERKEKKGVAKPSTTLECVVFLEPFKDVFHELFRLLKIAVVIPVSSASCERSFSTLKLIKSHLRTTMDNDRLSNLGILSIEARRARVLNMDDFVKQFASRHANRRIMLF